jgi:hypothetical protein
MRIRMKPRGQVASMVRQTADMWPLVCPGSGLFALASAGWVNI